MTRNEMEALEQWLMRAYQRDPNIDFAVLSTALKLIRAVAQ